MASFREDAISSALLFLGIHHRLLAFGYPQIFPRVFSIAVHKHPFTFVPIRVFC
jgi:hypothetical protein